MLAGFAPAIAADPGAEPDALRFVFTEALRVKDERTLESLARNSQVPQDVADALDASPIARVMVARLSRPGASVDKLKSAATDKRMGVGIAVASAVGLPDEVYEMVASSNKHPKVQTALVGNVSAPPAARFDAACFLASMPTSKWGSYRATYDLRARLSQFMEEYPAYAVFILKRAAQHATSMDAGLVASAVCSPGISEDLLRAVGTKIVSTIASPDYAKSSRHYYRETSVAEIAKAMANMADCPSDLLDAIDEAYAEHGDEASWERRNFNSARSNQRQRAAMPVGVAADDEGLAVSEKELRALLGQASSIQDRVRVARTYDLTDDQFVRVLLERSSGWSFSAEYADSPKFRSDVLSLTLESSGRPLRLAALALKMPWTFLDKDTVMASAAEVVVAISQLQSNQLLNRGPRDEWLRLVLTHGLDEDMARCVSVSTAQQQSLYVAGPDSLELSALWTAAVSRYLWSRFGAQLGAWDVFARVGGKLDVSLSEAASASLDALAGG